MFGTDKYFDKSEKMKWSNRLANKDTKVERDILVPCTKY